MPTFELVLLLKKAPVQQLKETLKRTALTILDLGCVIRNIENLGLRKTPYRIKKEKELYYFVMKYDSSEDQNRELSDHLHRDQDVIRKRIFFIEDKLRIEEKEKYECDIYNDMVDVPLRPHVQKMIEISKKNQRKPFYYGGGRNYDPLAR